MKEPKSVEWHMKCLDRWKEAYVEQATEIKRLASIQMKLLENIEFYTYQIEEAKKGRRAKFDRRRFKVEKNRKVTDVPGS